MGTARKCDARCHNAKGPRCECWCGGLFHGAGGARAREAFVAEFGAGIPELAGDSQGDLFADGGDRFRRALAAAREAKARPRRRR